MALFWRIPCHFCGARSQLPKWSPATQYQCSACEAWNFLDGKGHIVDTPITIAASASSAEMERSQKLWEARTRPAAQDPNQQQDQVFCNTCLQNQQIAREMLADYLPDEDDPRYAQFERTLPQYQRDLEARYPAICKACAPKAQRKINRADYYSGTSNIAVAMKQKRGGQPSRDDYGKWAMRVVLGVVGLVVWVAFYLQVAWHAYAIYNTILGRQAPGAEEDDAAFVFEPTSRSCLKAASRLHTDAACLDLLTRQMSRALLTTLLTIWYNRHLAAYYDPYTRYDRITGQGQHFFVQAITLLVRGYAYFYLSNPTLTAEMKWSELVAAHAATVALMLPARWIGARITTAHKWRLSGKKMMPKPEEEDVLGKTAGPAKERYVPQASSNLPFDIFAKKPDLPFPIDALAPNSSNSKPQRSAYGSHIWNRISGGPPPSPQASDDSGDAMDVDTHPVSDPFANMPGRPTTRAYPTASARQLRSSTINDRFGASQGQATGWGGMRDELFGIDDSMRAAESEMKRQQHEREKKLSYNPQPRQSPFYGRLPQAPMSMERRLRNPVRTMPEFKAPPVTQQSNFFEQMRPGGANSGSTADQAPVTNSRYTAFARDQGDDNSDFSPARNRTRGQLDLKPSSWHLESDTKHQTTGLEDLFSGRTFAISDDTALPSPVKVGMRSWSATEIVGSAAAVAGLGVVAVLVGGWWGVRRWVCLKLVEGIEWFGL